MQQNYGPMRQHVVKRFMVVYRKRTRTSLARSLRGHSQTTLTRFWVFLPPTHLCWHFLWYKCWQKVDIFGPSRKSTQQATMETKFHPYFWNLSSSKVCLVKKETKLNQVFCLIKSSKIICIFLPAFYLIVLLMTSPKNFVKTAILKIWQLFFF